MVVLNVKEEDVQGDIFPSEGVAKRVVANGDAPHSGSIKNFARLIIENLLATECTEGVATLMRGRAGWRGRAGRGGTGWAKP